MVFKAGWVDTIAEKYRRDVAECAVAIVEAMNTAAVAKKP
jgi:hypothetical protein